MPEYKIPRKCCWTCGRCQPYRSVQGPTVLKPECIGCLKDVWNDASKKPRNWIPRAITHA